MKHAPSQLNLDLQERLKKVVPVSLKKYLHPFAFIIYTLFFIGTFALEIYGETSIFGLGFIFILVNRFLYDYYYRVEPKEEQRGIFKLMKIYLRLSVWIGLIFFVFLLVEYFIRKG